MDEDDDGCNDDDIGGVDDDADDQAGSACKDQNWTVLFTKLPSRAIISILNDYGDDADDDQACSTCKDHNRTAAHYTKVSSSPIIRMIFHARRQETSLGVLVKGLCGTVRPDLGSSISNTDIYSV